MWQKLATWFLAGVSPMFIIGCFVYWWRNRRRTQNEYRSRVSRFLGLPDECKVILMEFVRRGHIVALPPHNQFVGILEKENIIWKHSSAGTFDAVKYNFTIDADFLSFLIEYTKHLPTP